MINIQRVAVIGPGTMGSQIAALLANLSIEVLLLGLPDSGVDRNATTRSLFEKAKRLSPPAFMLAEFAERIHIGNIEDDLGAVANCDWIIEAVFERIDIKRALHARLSTIISPNAFVTTNTSGLPLLEISEDLTKAYKNRLFGAHFFNPPRYMRLLEVIPLAETDPLLLAEFGAFATSTLGKGVVLAKDTPGFIANRIGCHSLQSVVVKSKLFNLSVEQADYLTGTLIGRPASGTFRLSDIIGIDLLSQLNKNLCESLTKRSEKEVFKELPHVSAMLERGWLGEKKGQGYYRRTTTPHGKVIEFLDLTTLSYQPKSGSVFPQIADIASLRGAANRISALYRSPTMAGTFVWEVLSDLLCYSADCIPEISDDIHAVDAAMRWGYNWELGPFQVWDVFGLKETADRLRGQNRPVPELVTTMLGAGFDRFYRESALAVEVYHPKSGQYIPLSGEKNRVSLNHRRAQREVILANSAGSLIDIGDGVACLEFHTKANAIGDLTLEVFEQVMAEIEKNFVGMVIGNDAPNFSAGADVTEFARLISLGNWTELEFFLDRFRSTIERLKRFPKPTVAAIRGHTLGGGCEVAFACSAIIADGEVSMGLPEAGLGLIPGAHGTTEFLVRWTNHVPRSIQTDHLSSVRDAWEILFNGRVSNNAREAIQMRLLRDGRDTVLMDRDQLLSAAKQRVLQLAGDYRPRPLARGIPALGVSGIATMRAILHAQRCAGRIGLHSELVGQKLAHVVCGGNLNGLHFVTENYVLECEREAFLSLCGESGTLERLKHFVSTGRKLNN